MLRHAVALALFSLWAKADTITAASNGYALTMQVSGMDTAGDFVQANLNPGDLAYVPSCSCPSGGSIRAIEAWDGIGSAMIGGVMHQGKEGGFTYISGTLPAIDSQRGSMVVLFPITWSVDIFFYDGVGLTAPVLFELRGSGTGIGSADLAVLQDQGPAYYAGDRFTYTSSVPEPSALSLLALGAAVIMAVRHA